MYQNIKVFFRSSLLAILLSNLNLAQDIGQIFSVEKADEIYGSVIDSKSISTSDLEDYLEETQDVIMFNLDSGNLIILGDDREVIYPNDGNPGENDVFRLFSKAKVSELLNLGSASHTYIETRQNTLTVTNGSYTLEVGWPCPPNCG